MEPEPHIVLNTIDVCETPSGKGCKTVVYGNVAQSADAAKTAGTVFINGHPACTKDAIFAKSSGDEAGRCGGIRSGTIKGKAEFITGSNSVLIEGIPAVRQFDLMVSNNRNTPPAPLMQSGGARPAFLDTVGEGPLQAEPPPWRFDWRIVGGEVQQLHGRWALLGGSAPDDRKSPPVYLSTAATIPGAAPGMQSCSPLKRGSSAMPWPCPKSTPTATPRPTTSSPSPSWAKARPAPTTPSPRAKTSPWPPSSASMAQKPATAPSSPCRNWAVTSAPLSYGS